MAYLLALSLAVLLTAVSGIPWPEPGREYAQPRAKVDSGLPVVGDTWGPLITHAGTMRTIATANQVIKHLYRYENPQDADSQSDVLADEILPTEIFSDKYEMHGYLQSKVGEDSIVVQLEPAILEGKYVEVLTSKAISPAAIKLVCHSFNTSPAFCHDVVNSSHKAKLMYSMVKSTDSGNVFPVVFFSHEGCSADNSCFWVTHVNEVVVLDKSVV